MGFAQNKLFDKYADMDDVTSVYISKLMMQMMPKIEKAGINFMNLKGKIESLQLVTTEKADRAAQMKKDFSQFVKTQHEVLMHVKEGKSRVSFYSSTKGDLIKELIMLVEDGNSFMAILLNGNFTLKDIQEFADQDK
jgi:hypothetical protein